MARLIGVYHTLIMKRGDLNVFGMLISAMVTPFLESGEIDYACVSQLIKQMEETKHDSIVVAGSTGEGHSLSIEEKLALFQYVKSHTKLKVIYSISQNSIMNLKKEMEQIDPLEPDGYLMVVPYYNLPPQRGIYLFFKEAASYTKRPIIIYNVPSRTGVNIAPQTCARLAEHPNICGIKEASGNISQIAEIASLVEGKMDIYSGNDDQIVPIMALGGKGVISVLSNVMPKETVEICDRFFSGDVSGSLKLQLKYLPLIKALFSEVNPIPVKAAMSAMGYGEDYLRLPLTPMEEAHRRVLFAEMKKQGIDIKEN